MSHHHHHEHGGEGTPGVHVYHITAPTCWWSWGYEATLNRAALVYGDQIAINTYVGCVYTDLAEYKTQYELDDEGLKAWRDEAVEIMDVPLAALGGFGDWPETVLPASVALMAAFGEGAEKAARFQRAVLRRFCVEGRSEATSERGLLEAAREAGLDGKRLAKALEDEEALLARMEGQGEGWPHVPLGFYNLAVTDHEGTTVLLDNAFEPAMLERAIDMLLPGATKEEPTDIGGYLAAHGPAPTSEIARVFGMDREEATRALEGLVKEGRATATPLAGSAHWGPA